MRLEDHEDEDALPPWLKKMGRATQWISNCMVTTNGVRCEKRGHGSQTLYNGGGGGLRDTEAEKEQRSTADASSRG